MKQLSIDFNPSITKAYSTCVEYVSHRVHSIGILQRDIAADLDLSPSHLTRKLAQSPNDSMRFTLDNFEKYIQTTKDIAPIKYLVAKYLDVQPDSIENLLSSLSDEQKEQIKKELSK